MTISFRYDGRQTQVFDPLSNPLTGIAQFNDVLQLKTISFQETFPSIQFNATWKGNITQRISFDIVNSSIEQQTQRTNTKLTTFTTSIGYVKRGGFWIPFISKRKLNNEIRMNLQFSYSTSKSIAQFGQRDQQTNELIINTSQTQEESVSWSLHPRIDYSFTRRLTGGMFFRFESRKNLKTGKISTISGGITVNISIGG